MNNLAINDLFADRIGGKNFKNNISIYKFENIKKNRNKLINENSKLSLIDLGVGEPNILTDMGIINTLNCESKKFKNCGYADNGILEFNISASNYLKNVFNVDNINPENEVIHIIGSKSALALLPLAFINPNDITLTTIPGYPVISTITKWIGGKVYPLPLYKSNNFLPDLNNIPDNILKRAKLLYINYPNNPTGATASTEFFKRVVDFGLKHNILIIHDAAYSAITFDSTSPLSFLSVPNAKNIGIEIHSLSKSYSMTGWRIGFIAGNKDIIKAYSFIKENTDSGQFKAIQLSAKYALEHPEITKNLANIYSRRHDKLINILKKLGFNVSKPKASFYLYVPIPKAIKNGPIFYNAEDFSNYLMIEKRILCVPWDDVGSYIRLSVTFPAKSIEEEDKIIKDIYNRLKNTKFIF